LLATVDLLVVVVVVVVVVGGSRMGHSEAFVPVFPGLVWSRIMAMDCLEIFLMSLTCSLPLHSASVSSWSVQPENRLVRIWQRSSSGLAALEKIVALAESSQFRNANSASLISSSVHTSAA